MLTSVPANVRMDVVHANLIGALVGAHKPASILELGMGSGRVTDAILNAMYDAWPTRESMPSFRVVDNWQDWGDQGKPEAAIEAEYGKAPVEFVTVDDERSFIFTTLLEPVTRYDFIVSDADHHHAHEWFDEVYVNVLNPGGVLIYHDVSRGYGGLAEIVQRCRTGYRHVVFDKNSLASEQCDRGLLVVFKP